MSAVKTYDPDQISIAIVGIPVTGGFAEGSMVDIEQDEDGFVEVVGTGGDVTRSKKLNRMCTMTLRLMQASDSNALLSALYNLDQNAPNGAGIGSSEVKDLAGTSVFFDATDTVREWKIRGKITLRVDGSN